MTIPRLHACALAAVLLGFGAAAVGQALPFLPAGDSRLRHDAELLGDEGAVPLVTTWPLPTADLTAAYREAKHPSTQPTDAQDAGWFMSGAARPTRLRVYEDTPREQGEVGLAGGWAAGDYAGGALRLAFDIHPQDGMKYRFDGSYASWRLGNWWVSLGMQDRWWGPGWDGSLILSNNARPMPGIALDRVSSLAPESRWLRWIGPWRITTMMNRMEDHRLDVDKPLFWGFRATLAPIAGLELGLTRTAIWCGSGRPCGVGTFVDLLAARQNQLANSFQIPNSDKPGTQHAALDLRYKIPRSPLAIYWQEYAEAFDNHDYRPRQTLQLFGIEAASRSIADGRLRTFFEFAGTTCGELSSSPGGVPNYGCAYEKDIYSVGYRYRDRTIGDAIDRDGRRFTLGTLFVDASDRTWQARVRRIELNRGNYAEVGLVPQTVSTTAEQLWNIELSLAGQARGFHFDAGVGGDWLRVSGQETHHLLPRGFLTIARPW